MKQQYGREISLGEKLIVFASSHITNRLQTEKYGLSHRFRGYIWNLVFDFEDAIDSVPVGLTDIYLQLAITWVVPNVSPVEVTETVISMNRLFLLNSSSNISDMSCQSSRKSSIS